MNPLLRALDVDPIVERLLSAGDTQAADALRALRDAIHRQDEALRDLVADAREISENVEEDGVYTDLHSSPGGFEALFKAFGYPAVEGYDLARIEAAKVAPGGPDYMEGVVQLTGLDHLQAVMAAEGMSPESMRERGAREIRTGHGPNARTLWYEEPAPVGAPPMP